MPDLRRLMNPITSAKTPAISTLSSTAGSTFMLSSLKLQTAV